MRTYNNATVTLQSLASSIYIINAVVSFNHTMASLAYLLMLSLQHFNSMYVGCCRVMEDKQTRCRASETIPTAWLLL